jgi:hypothetical protein
MGQALRKPATGYLTFTGACFIVIAYFSGDPPADFQALLYFEEVLNVRIRTVAEKPNYEKKGEYEKQG